MRLLTHNYMQSTVKGTENGYPLQIEADKIEYEESPFDPDFVIALIPKIEYKTILFAVQQIAERCSTDLPSEIQLPDLPETIEKDDNSEYDKELLKKLHVVLLDIHVVQGHLVCPGTGRRFKITQGIPNMILHEDEI
eukprot:CAMPEP_0204624736 /NCGR_PEP_ID=MMETSP0717-20131115/10476_1 /ASSEMBLY_ACC=CAM_ASM_000666 /TAXON_ID=230516 /ORGANISM="Chaetoceros curvisetus" /LENGTH=136 /DNA_ID=CAMNT_0051640221 /DNA_START=96 /DNA_END=506 /DNA_ORIENTATION=+